MTATKRISAQLDYEQNMLTEAQHDLAIALHATGGAQTEKVKLTEARVSIRELRIQVLTRHYLNEINAEIAEVAGRFTGAIADMRTKGYLT